MPDPVTVAAEACQACQALNQRAHRCMFFPTRPHALGRPDDSQGIRARHKRRRPVRGTSCFHPARGHHDAPVLCSTRPPASMHLNSLSLGRGNSILLVSSPVPHQGMHTHCCTPTSLRSLPSWRQRSHPTSGEISPTSGMFPYCPSFLLLASPVVFSEWRSTHSRHSPHPTGPTGPEICTAT